MRSLLRHVFLCLVSAVCFCSFAADVLPAILTSADVLNGRVNITSSRLNGSVDFSDETGAAVNYLITGSEEMGQEAKVQLLRRVLTAREGLSDADGTVGDISSKALVDALIMVDLLSGRDAMSEEEWMGVRSSLYQVIEYYLDPAVFAWDQEEWSLGVPALRIATACILYAFNFADGSEAQRYLDHGMHIFRYNLLNSVDDYGAWLPDSPGDAAEAVYEMIVAAKAMKNRGFEDHFANHRFRNFLLYHMRLLPPQQCPFVKGEYMIAGIGRTDPSANYGSIPVLGAKDLYAHYPNEASYLMWYWNQCGNPVHPLGILFIDPSIPYMRPDKPAGLIGGGAAILRDKPYTPAESDIIVSFGDGYGMPDRSRRDHADHGDFSLIWQGMPLIVHESGVQDDCSERLMNASAWRHSVVVPYQSGNSRAVREKAFQNEMSPVPAAGDTSKIKRIPADMYTDGIRQYLSTPMVDYVAGDVRLAGQDMPSDSHYRHFLFLKPDALLVWDQVKSPKQLEWGLWMPAERMHQDGNVLQLFKNDGYELHVLFAGENELDASMENAPEEIAADWPLIMSARYGRGSVVLVTADLFGAGELPTARVTIDTTGIDETERMLMENLLHLYGSPGFTGLLAGADSPIEDLLSGMDLSHERMFPGDFAVIGPARYGTVVVDDSLSAADTAVLNDHTQGIWRYVRDGGKLIWCVRSSRTLRPSTPAGRGTLPVTLDPAGCVLDLFRDTDPSNGLVMNPDDSLWTNLNTISRESFAAVVSGGSDSTCTAVLPAAWSDQWNVHASIHAGIPVQAYASEAFGVPRRISVKKQAASDFFTLLLPRKTDSPYRFNVSRSGPGFVVFADPASTWEVSTGQTAWTDANLSVRITRNGTAEEFYAFDCNFVDLGVDKLFSDKPMTVHYSVRDDKGSISAAESALLSFHMGDIRIHAGEVDFRGLKTDIELDRSAFVSTVAVLDQNGAPVPWVTIETDGRFAGKTGPGGRLPLRWYGRQPEVTVTHRGAKFTQLLVPGTMVFEIQEAQ